MRIRHEKFENTLDIAEPEIIENDEDTQTNEDKKTENIIMRFIEQAGTAIEALTALIEDDPHPKTGEAIAALIQSGTQAVEKLSSIKKIEAETRKLHASAKKIERENSGEAKPMLPENTVNIDKAVIVGTLSDVLKKNNALSD